ncbi:hypothetical protein F0M18_15705 [Pseudohalioglobus sediminis]|uniref:Nuclear transport factor 2 family protein n=1 Tax=Pseudohalioglobus sediminis TaxID=2606449 RepID=A0A5B0WSA1_9GAMM|nr:hypothetical protein [Pseudohalioglobus sediminis]KAA1189121.1 hypothetical protein F0M18_15705 [Pseudohalioglobus sediminis]
MTAFATATAFFHACEGLQGWQGCAQYIADGAAFSAQCEPLVDISSVADYCEWMAGLGNGPLPGCGYTLHSSAWDEANRTALFFATFNGKHTGEGGPVAATGSETHTHYVYAITMDADGKVCAMTKIWNAPWALKELGWA